PNIRYLFVTYPNYYQEAKVLTRYAVEELGLRRIAVIYQNDQYGDNGRRGVIDALAEMGMEPVAAVPYELTDADLSVQALLIGQAQADAVILYATPTHGAMAAAALAQLNPKPQILSSFTLADPIMAALAGEAWHGVIVPGYFPYPDLVPYELTDADLSVQALLIGQAQADAVILYATPTHGAMAAAALAQLNPKPQILSSFTLADPIMAALAGEAWNGVIVPGYFPY